MSTWLANCILPGSTPLIYGTDGELALEKAMENVYPIHGVGQQNQSIHLRCFTHVADDMLAEATKPGCSKEKCTTNSKCNPWA